MTLILPVINLQLLSLKYIKLQSLGLPKDAEIYFFMTNVSLILMFT